MPRLYVPDWRSSRATTARGYPTQHLIFFGHPDYTTAAPTNIWATDNAGQGSVRARRTGLQNRAPREGAVKRK